MNDLASTIESLVLPLNESSDFAMPVLSDEAATELNILPEVLDSISKAVGDLLERLPTADTDIDEGTYFSPSQNLPAVINQAPALPGRDAIKWRKLGRLPGFVDPRIRKMGQDVFNSFPCFRQFSEECRKQNVNAHANALVASEFTNGHAEIDYLAKTILEKGEIIEVGHMDHGAAVPGYAPEIAIFMTANWTFKLVRDSAAFGAPVELNSIYAWPGGKNFYKRSLERPVNIPRLDHPDNLTL